MTFFKGCYPLQNRVFKYICRQRNIRMKRNYNHLLLAGSLIFLAAASRVVFSEANFYNFAPVGALGLFAGAVIKDKRYAFLFPLLAMFSADLYFQLFTSTPGFYDISQFFTYAGMAAATVLGFRMGKTAPVKVFGLTLAASTVFFLVSNFGVWLQGWYGSGLQALVQTYVMAIPFYKNTLIGDLAGSIILFGSYSLIQKMIASKIQEIRAV